MNSRISSPRRITRIGSLSSFSSFTRSLAVERFEEAHAGSLELGALKMEPESFPAGGFELPEQRLEPIPLDSLCLEADGALFR